jgi:hypothetical protein
MIKVMALLRSGVEGLRRVGNITNRDLNMQWDFR